MKLLLLANITLQVAAKSFAELKNDYVKYFPDKFMLNAVSDKVMQQREADKQERIVTVSKRQRDKRRKRRQRFVKNYVKKLRYWNKLNKPWYRLVTGVFIRSTTFSLRARKSFDDLTGLECTFFLRTEAAKVFESEELPYP